MAFKGICRGLIAIAALGLLSGCASAKNVTLSPPDPAYTKTEVVDEYRIAPLDRLSINVFPARDFSLPSTRVDANGSFLMPPIGAVEAQGKTVSELGKELEARLSSCCLQRPQVVVLVEESTSRQITVTGAVVASDVYNLRGPTTLMQAISMAKGPDRTTANLHRVAVYRMSGGRRTGAIFDVEAIREGKAIDPQVYGGDTIIVDSSAAKSAWHSVIQAIPFVGLFAAF